jgi:hypothetical protein
MAVWENIPECKRESINKSLYRFDRIQKRKSKIKNLCLLQEGGVKMVGNTDKKTI